jgi:ribosomal protein S18 acetylase RimI-like enzyme
VETLHFEIANQSDLVTLLGMMEPFNVFEQVPWDRTATERALQTLLADRSLGVAVLLERAGAPVGYFVLSWGFDLEWNGRDAFLTELFVLPALRGIGLGSVAMRIVEGVARDHGARALHLMVRRENLVAQRLYAGHGYTSPERIFLSKVLDG